MIYGHRLVVCINIINYSQVSFLVATQAFQMSVIRHIIHLGLSTVIQRTGIGHKWAVLCLLLCMPVSVIRRFVGLEVH